MKPTSVVWILLLVVAPGCLSHGYDYRIEQYEAPTHEKLAILFVHRSASDQLKGEYEATPFLRYKVGPSAVPQLLRSSQTLNGDRNFFFVLDKPASEMRRSESELARLRNQVMMISEMRLEHDLQGYLGKELPAAR